MKRNGTCHALWIGDRLPPLAKGCLGSFVRQGHKVVLHSYKDLDNVPAGVEVRDAALVIPQDKIIRHAKTNSPSLFSNYFRYKLWEQDQGYWIDCDLYCIRPIHIEDNPVFGRQDNGLINGAILRLDADCPLRTSLLRLFEDKTAEFPWIRPRARIRARIKSMLFGKPKIAYMPWGSCGPNAITWLARHHKLDGKALAEEVFYPLPLAKAPLLSESSFDIGPEIKTNSLTIHLWNEVIGPKRDKPDPGSFLDRLYREADGGAPAFVVD